MTTAALNKLYFGFDLEKRNDEEQIVEGIASTESVDSDGETITYEAMKAAANDFMKWANLREMHGLSAAGTVMKIICDDVTRTVRIVAKVVDKQAWEKVKTKVYKGFSIGGKALARLGTAVTKLRLTEISLVDRPANPDAVIELYKAAKDEDIQKGMWTLGRLAQAYDTIEMIRADVVREENAEGDTESELPKLLKDVCKKLGLAVVAMASEEVTEMNGRSVALAEKGDAMKVKRSDIEEKIKKAMDECYKASDEAEDTDVAKSISGALTNPNMSVPVQLAEKSADLKKVNATLASINKALGLDKADEPAKAEEQGEILKALGSTLTAVEALAKKVEDMGKAIVPAKATATNLTKAEDTKPEVEEKKAKDLTDPEVTKAMKPTDIIKAIHAQGHQG